jgi:hypothetical protein
MDLEALWDHARKQTEIIRMQLRDLPTFESTVVPYVFLAESSLNVGDTVRRRGHVVIERPSIVLPQFSPQFEGFEFEPVPGLTPEMVSTFLLVRGIHFPSLRYRHQLSTLDVMETSLAEAIRRQADQLQRAEDTRTGLVIGPEEAWTFSVLLLVGALVIRSAEGDLRRLLEQWRRRQQGTP